MRPINLLVLVTTLFTILTMGQVHAGWNDKLQEMWNSAKGTVQDSYKGNWSVLPGKINVCVAKELNDWMTNIVIPRFNEKAPRVKVAIEAHGSGGLVDAMNAGNTMKCDILIPGSDVSAMRWNGYDLNKKTSVAYSPTVWVGDKEKLDAARSFLGKAMGDPLTCSDLANAAKQRRYAKIKEGGKGKVDIEMTTSNSGQSMYVSCVYSILDAIDPQDVEDKLNENPALEDQVRDFFKTVKFKVSSTTTLSVKAEGQFMHPNGIGYKHLAIATYESFLPELSKKFQEQGKEMEVIYPVVSILNNFPVTRITTEGKNGEATKVFVDYMTQVEVQQELVQFGFRPANPQVDYKNAPTGSFFNNNIEVGDSPSSQQMLRDLWDIVSDDPKSKAAQF